MAGLKKADLHELLKLCPGGVEQKVNLSAMSQWRIGGYADVIVRPSSTKQVAALMRWFYSKNITPVVIGSTSNLLFADEGLRVPVLNISDRMANICISKNNVSAQAGLWVPQMSRKLMLAGLTGAEHICGIPGALGGLIFMNGGSQRKSIGSSILEVESVDPKGLVRVRSSAECKFGYRTSVFQTNGEIITSARLNFSSAPHAVIRRDMLKILKERSRKFPRKIPNCGSVFKSDPKMYKEIGPPGEVIERLGLKGLREGGAEVSAQHANFIVNKGHARASDVLKLISRMSCEVYEKTGFKMEVEVCFVGSDGHVRPAGTP